MKKNCCELTAPERLVTGTPFCSWVSPFAAVTVTCAVAPWLTVPEVPVTVNVVAAEAGAVEAAVRVRVELPPAVTVAGLKAPVTPVGRPATDRETLCVLPFSADVDTVYVAVAPAATVLLAGEIEMPKSGGGGGPWTVSVTVVECEMLGEVPVTVSVYVPAAAVPVFTVSVELPPAVTEVGFRVAVAPAGVPLTERSMVSAVPDTSAVEMVLVPVAFCPSVSAFGLAEMEKSFVTCGPQLGNLKDPIRVFQLKEPFAGRYSVVYQKVQSSEGSTAIIE